MTRKGQRRTLALLLVLSGCSTGGQNLTPAPRAQAIAGEPSAAEESDSQARIVANAEAWPGEARVTEEVTPLLVTIDNDGPHPLLLAYEGFLLQGSSNDYAVLPPFQIDGDVDSAAVVPTTRWRQRDFAAAPYYGAYNPHTTLHATDVTGGSGYYDTYYGRWEQTEQLPTPEMLSWALPEGVIEPGGSVSGFLYFERVDDDEGDVRFRARLRNAETGMEIVNVSIPFMVVDD